MQNTEILNTGLALAMEWGPEWLKPIQSRLAEKFPELSEGELEVCSAICQSAMAFGHQQVLTLAKGLEGNQAVWETELLRVYPWVSHENLSRLFSQGMYYSLK